MSTPRLKLKACASAVVVVVVALVLADIMQLPTAQAATPADFKKQQQALVMLYRRLLGDTWSRASWPIDTVTGTASEAVCTWDPSTVSCDFSKKRIIGLDISTINATGKVSRSLNTLTALRELYLHDNPGITEMAYLGKMSSLQVLDIHSCTLSGTFPEWIPRLWTLTRLIVSQNSFSGTLPTTLSKLVNLKKLDVSFNNFVGTVPAELASLTSLVEVKLCGNSPSLVPLSTWQATVLPCS